MNKMALELKKLLISETVKGRFESRHVANTFLAFAKVNQCAEDPKFRFKLKTLTKSAVLKNMNAHELSMVMVGVSLVNESNGEVGGEDDEEEDEELAYEVCRFFTKTIASYTDDTNNETDGDETGKVGLIANVRALSETSATPGGNRKETRKGFHQRDTTRTRAVERYRQHERTTGVHHSLVARENRRRGWFRRYRNQIYV